MLRIPRPRRGAYPPEWGIFYAAVPRFGTPSCYFAVIIKTPALQFNSTDVTLFSGDEFTVTSPNGIDNITKGITMSKVSGYKLYQIIYLPYNDSKASAAEPVQLPFALPAEYAE